MYPKAMSVWANEREGRNIACIDDLLAGTTRIIVSAGHRSAEFQLAQLDLNLSDAPDEIYLKNFFRILNDFQELPFDPPSI